MTTTSAPRLLVADGTSSLPLPWLRHETVHALTRLELLVGFRDPARSAALLADLRRPWADDLATRILLPDGLRDVADRVRSTPRAALVRQAPELGVACRAAEAAAHRAVAGRRRPHPPEHPDREALRVHALVARLAADHPADPGALLALLLNHVVLAPGERLTVSAGTVVAHTAGHGVATPAPSGGPLGAGPATDPVPTSPRPVRLRRPSGPARPRVDVDALVLLAVHEVATVLPPGPQLVLCVDGAVTVSGSTGPTRLERGAWAAVGEDEGPVTVRGAGRVAVHRPPATAYPSVARRAA
ncbi:MAG: hypothetical protein Q7T56_12675 [Nocardioidaceae bacterium]|nr:hypothetical protein [Nocardioidaceae bacterium]